jgi:hypothetical protein
MTMVPPAQLFLDVIAFLGHLVTEGLDKAVGDRTRNFQDLL